MFQSQNPRINLELYDDYSDDVLRLIHRLDREIFDEAYDFERLQQKSCNVKNALILVAVIEGRAVGFKAGHQRENFFYSWIGGVSKNFRRQGVAEKLMLKQHEIIAQRGFDRIRTHTDTRFSEMFALNLKFGFSEVGRVERNGLPDKIILEKSLNESPPELV